MNIVVYSRGCQAKLFTKMQFIINQKRKDIDFIHIINDEDDKENVLKYNATAIMENINQYISNNFNKYTKDEIFIKVKEMQMKYNGIDLWKAISTDRFLREKNIEKSYKYLVLVMEFWEEIFQKYKPVLFINETVAFIYPYLAYIACKRFNVLYQGLYYARITKRFYITNDLVGHSISIEHYYNKYNKNMEKYKLENAKVFVEKFIINKVKPCQKIDKRKRSKNIIKRLSNIIRNPQEYEKLDLTKPNSNIAIHYIRSHIKSYIKKKIYKLVKFDKPKYQEDYFLFPLHFEPEATVYISATYYMNQLSTIETISRLLPIGTFLYVKEHPDAIGTRNSLSFYKKIQNIPNVKLISASEDIFEFIEHSIAVIHLANTTALEAIFRRKPIIMLGDQYWDIYKHSNKINSWKEFEDVLNKIYKEKNKLIPERDMLIFVASILDGTNEANILYQDMNQVLEKENIIKIFKALVENYQLNRGSKLSVEGNKKFINKENILNNIVDKILLI